MCRNIKRLRQPDRTPLDQELRDAALQFVRKISGYHAPSQSNRAAFDAAVEDVAAASRRLFETLNTRPHAPRPAGRMSSRPAGPA